MVVRGSPTTDRDQDFGLWGIPPTREIFTINREEFDDPEFHATC